MAAGTAQASAADFRLPRLAARSADDAMRALFASPHPSFCAVRASFTSGHASFVSVPRIVRLLARVVHFCAPIICLRDSVVCLLHSIVRLWDSAVSLLHFVVRLPHSIVRLFDSAVCLLHSIVRLLDSIVCFSHIDEARRRPAKGHREHKGDRRIYWCIWVIQEMFVPSLFVLTWPPARAQCRFDPKGFGNLFGPTVWPVRTTALH